MTTPELDALLSLLRRHKVQSYTGEGVTIGFSAYAMLDESKTPVAELTEEQRRELEENQRKEEEALLFYSSEG